MAAKSQERGATFRKLYSRVPLGLIEDILLTTDISVLVLLWSRKHHLCLYELISCRDEERGFTVQSTTQSILTQSSLHTAALSENTLASAGGRKHDICSLFCYYCPAFVVK